MKINPLLVNNKNQIKTNSSFYAKKDVQENNSLNSYTKISDFRLLSSKFNISFKGENDNYESDFLYQKLAQKIANLINPLDFDVKDMKFPIQSNLDLKFLNQVFRNDNISSILPVGVSLSNALTYLNIKGQIELCEALPKSKSAFFVDKYSVEYLDEYNLAKDFRKYVKQGEIKFYALNQNQDELNELSEKLNALFGLDIDITQLNTHFGDETLYPSEDDIRLAICDCAKKDGAFAPDEKKKYTDAVLRYLNNSLECYSYQRIAKELKNLYQKIQSWVCKKGKTMEDVRFVVPYLDKSYSLINYMFACENDVSPDKFLAEDSVFYENDNDLIYVILDDCALSGDSILDISKIAIFNKHGFLFCPLIMSKSAKEKIEDLQNVDIICENVHITLGDMINNRELICGSNLSDDDVDYLANMLRCGYDKGFCEVIFPYMIPDNCSDIIGVLGSYFLLNNSKKANKTLPYIADMSEYNKNKSLDFEFHKENNIKKEYSIKINKSF